MKYVFLPVNETCDLYSSIVQLLMHDDIQVNYTLITKVVFSVHFRKSEKTVFLNIVFNSYLIS